MSTFYALILDFSFLSHNGICFTINAPTNYYFWCKIWIWNVSDIRCRYWLTARLLLFITLLLLPTSLSFRWMPNGKWEFSKTLPCAKMFCFAQLRGRKLIWKLFRCENNSARRTIRPRKLFDRRNLVIVISISALNRKSFCWKNSGNLLKILFRWGNF